jgi:heme exporter protein D
MLNLKALMVGFGFLLAIIIFLVHKIKARSAHKKKIAETKNRRNRNKKKKNRKRK